MNPSISKAKPECVFLLANSESYEWLVEKIQFIDPRTETETVLRKIVSAARFAAVFHPGRFADGAIENVALKIGVELGDAEIGNWQPPVVQKQNRRRILHVATEVSRIGGHTRMLFHWIQNDQHSCHSVLLLSQPEEVTVPRWLSDAVKSSGGELLVFSSTVALLKKAQWLRKAAIRIADLVVLHHCPFDVVPIIAFAVSDCPPVAVLNHADHLFWLGSSVTDMVINLRTAGSEHTAGRRFVERNTVLPIPLTNPTNRLSRKNARLALGIPEDQIMLLSVGREEKYRPCGAYDFVATAGKILDYHPGAHLYVVGGSIATIAPYLRCKLHERLHFVGSIEEPVEYWSAADIYLESFPFGSNTALLEAALSGLPVVPAYAPLFPLLVANDDSVCDLLPNPENEMEYIDRVDYLIRMPEKRAELADALQNRLLADHTKEGWLKRLTSIYKETDLLSHNPVMIPITHCATTDADIGLSQWHVMADGKTNSSGVPVDRLDAVFCHAAFVTKEVGNYASARWYAWRSVNYDPFRWTSWRLLGITLLGKTGLSIRRMFLHA